VGDMEEDECEAREASELAGKIMSGKSLDEQEMYTVSESMVLRNVFQYRWQ
jgi:hypothetical protein